MIVKDVVCSFKKLNMDASWKMSRWDRDSGAVLRRDNQWVHKTLNFIYLVKKIVFCHSKFQEN